MISISPPTYTYLDQLLSETWVRWSESILCTSHPSRFSSARGFQSAIESIEGSVGANERTRAGEFYLAGFLRGRLVNERGTGGRRGDIPSGWDLVQNDEHVHTHIGYLSYAIGKALSKGYSSSYIKSALSALSSLVILQCLVPYNDTSISLLALYKQLLSSFQLPSGYPNHKWNRYLAAAMFCSLNDDSIRTSIIKSALSNKPINSLIITSNGSITTIKPSSFPRAIAAHALSSIDRPKDSLFWVGDASVEKPRGIYSLATSEFDNFLDSVLKIELSAIRSGMRNPLNNVASDDPSGERGCVISKMNDVATSDSSCKLETERLMKSIYQGVMDSLRYINQDDVAGTKDPCILFAHGIKEDEEVSGQFRLTVPKIGVQRTPKMNDVVVVKSKAFHVSMISEDDGNYMITLG